MTSYLDYAFSLSMSMSVPASYMLHMLFAYSEVIGRGCAYTATCDPRIDFQTGQATATQFFSTMILVARWKGCCAKLMSNHHVRDHPGSP